MVQLNRELNGDQFEKTWGNLFFFVENTVELLKKNYICTIHYRVIMNEVNFNRMFGQQGWICPKCGRVYSPFTQMCLYCGNNNSENTFTSANTPTKTFDEILESNRDVLERIKQKGD